MYFLRVLAVTIVGGLIGYTLATCGVRSSIVARSHI